MSHKRLAFLTLLTLACVYGAYTLLTSSESTGDIAVDADPRNEERTLVTFPEWYIVYSAQEYADFVAQGGRPSQFPYFSAIKQFWESVDQVYAHVDPNLIDAESKTVIRVIGISFTVEYGIVGAYEKTIGRVSEALHLFKPTTEDVFTNQVARDYGAFLTHTPWYDFPYFKTLGALWKTYGFDSLSPRGLERRLSYTIGYTLKGTYGAGLAYLTHSTYGYVEDATAFTLSGVSAPSLGDVGGVVESHVTGNLTATGTLMRYRAFRDPALTLLRSGNTFTEIEGNQRILLTFLQPTTDTCFSDTEHVALSLPLLTDTKTRVGLLLPLEKLGSTVRALDACNIPIEHLYDY